MMHKFKLAWEWCLLLLGLAYWAVAGLSITFLSTVLIWLLPKRIALQCGYFLLSRAFRLFIAYLRISRLLILEDDDLKHLATFEGAAIIAPNHIALWDAVFIIARLPDIACIMKGAILRNPFLGGGARLAGYIANDSRGQMLRAAVARLKQGDKLLLFPEGTRTKPDAQWLNPLKGGIALLAKKAQVPVIPVFIRSNTRYFEKGWPLYRKPKFPLHISITVAEPVIMLPDESPQAFGKRLEKMYIAELSRPHPLRRQPHHGC